VTTETWGPFVLRELVRRPDGQVVEFTARRHRKGRGPRLAEGDRPAPRMHAVVWAPGDIGWYVGILFMIGSACFAFGSTPGMTSVVPVATISLIYFIGSLFFTTAGYLQFVQAINANPDGTGQIRRWFGFSPRGLGWWAAFVQLIGTLAFNVTTFAALNEHLTAHQQDRRVWSPDVVGSICFLIASWFAVEEVRKPKGPRWRWSEIPWRIVWLNMIGSIFFMLSAIGAFIVPSTESLLSAGLANGGTFLGAVCFFWGAWLLLVELADVPAAEPVG
jgi:hypothetical protein